MISTSINQKDIISSKKERKIKKNINKNLISETDTTSKEIKEKNGNKSKQTEYHKLRLMVSIIMILMAFFAFIFMQKSPDCPVFPNLDNITPPNGRFLVPFLQPRYPGSEGSKRVQDFLISHFQSLSNWHIEKDEFDRRVPLMSHPVRFTNLIFTLDMEGKMKKKRRERDEYKKSLSPSNQKRIILAAHYDSKFRVNGMRDGTFIGATDSAWSCALLVEIATSISKCMNSKMMPMSREQSSPSSPSSSSNPTLQIIFFDGEEAFLDWSRDDSLYGSRHLASKIQDHHNIQLMVLLDLLGAPSPRLSSMMSSTRNYHLQMMNIEKKLRGLGMIQQSLPMIFHEGSRHQANHVNQIAVQDDHVPFVEKGVQVLHLIPFPFPNVWHSPRDNVDALDKSICHALALIVYEFTREMLLLPLSK